jgi:hypothetical protein
MYSCGFAGDSSAPTRPRVFYNSRFSQRFDTVPDARPDVVLRQGNALVAAALNT